MRVLNVLRNSAYSMVFYVLAAVLGILLRQAFTRYMPIELLGLEGLFSNLLTILSLAELGVSTVISYGLYREFANGNEQEINMLMSVYRYIYLVIGTFVFLVGVVLFFFLPWIVQDDSISWYYVEFVYMIQIGTVLSSYFLAYRRTLFTANQKDFVCSRADIACTLSSNLVKFLAVIVWQDYFLYAATGLTFNIIANVYLHRKAGKMYPFLHSVKVTVADMRARKFFTDIGNFLVHKLSYVIYFGTDAIVVSTVLGLRMAGLLSNYILIYTGVNSIMYKILQGIIPSVGNLIYAEDKEKSYKVYRMLDMMYLFWGAYIACIYAVVLQPFMRTFFGGDFLLPEAYVIALAVNTLLGIQFENAYNFRSTHGTFDNDRSYMVASAAVNLFLSIGLVYVYGIVGIMIGTIAGLLCIVYGRVQFVFRIIFKRSMKSYLWSHLRWSLLVAVEILLIYIMVDYLALPDTYLYLVVKCLLIAVLMGAMQILFFHRTQEFKDICSYMKTVKGLIYEKLHKGKV